MTAHSPSSYKTIINRLTFPQPKSHSSEPTPADFEAFGRRMYSSLSRLDELALEEQRIRQDMRQAKREMTLLVNPEMVEICGQCYDRHLGPCNG